MLQPPKPINFVCQLTVFLEGLGFQEQIRATVLAQAKDVSARFTNGLLFNQRMGELFTPFLGNIHGAFFPMETRTNSTSSREGLENFLSLTIIEMKQSYLIVSDRINTLMPLLTVSGRDHGGLFMKLEERMQSAIDGMLGNVILRMDIATLGGHSQVSVALDELMRKGVIVRMGIGIYAKASRHPVTGVVTPVANLETLAVEVLQRLGVSASVQVAKSGAGRLVASKDARICIKGSRRIRRKLSLGGRSVVYVNELASPRKPKSSVRRHPKTGALIIPKSGLRRYVMDLAEACQVAYIRTYADEWAENISRLAGDDVQTDVIENLVIALKKEKKVTGLEAVHLLTNYLREKQRV